MAPSSGTQNGPPSTTGGGNDWMHNNLDMKVSFFSTQFLLRIFPTGVYAIVENSSTAQSIYVFGDGLVGWRRHSLQAVVKSLNKR